MLQAYSLGQGIRKFWPHSTKCRQTYSACHDEVRLAHHILMPVMPGMRVCGVCPAHAFTAKNIFLMTSIHSFLKTHRLTCLVCWLAGQDITHKVIGLLEDLKHLCMHSQTKLHKPSDKVHNVTVHRQSLDPEIVDRAPIPI